MRTTAMRTRNAENNRKWRAANRDRLNAIANKHRGSVAQRFKAMKNRAKGSSCMTFEEYKSLEGLPCYYCGWPRPEKGSGIDRIDNSKGYELINCVPCCTECNTARNNHFTEEEMLRIGEVIGQIKRDRLSRSPGSGNPAFILR